MSETGRRDALGIAFQVLHIAVLIYLLIGWSLPYVGVYVVFVPVMVLHWPLNRNTCVINNLESLIRYGQWRSVQNPEEGVWIKLLIKSALGIDLSRRQSDALSYGLLAVLWGLGYWHWLGW
jgi:hypothetical protein